MARARRTGRASDYQWGNFGDQMSTQDIGAEATFGTSALTPGLAATCVRLRGKVGVTLDTGAPDESVIVLLGVAVVPLDMFQAGAAPELFTGADDEMSWLWQGALYVSSGAQGAVINEFLVASIEVDSKAMRKAKATDVVAFVFEAPTELARDQTGTFDLVYFFHALNAT